MSMLYHNFFFKKKKKTSIIVWTFGSWYCLLLTHNGMTTQIEDAKNIRPLVCWLFNAVLHTKTKKCSSHVMTYPRQPDDTEVESNPDSWRLTHRRARNFERALHARLEPIPPEMERKDSDSQRTPKPFLFAFKTFVDTRPSECIQQQQ